MQASLHMQRAMYWLRCRYSPLHYTILCELPMIADVSSAWPPIRLMPDSYGRPHILFTSVIAALPVWQICACLQHVAGHILAGHTRMKFRRDLISAYPLLADERLASVLVELVADSYITVPGVVQTWRPILRPEILGILGKVSTAVVAEKLSRLNCEGVTSVLADTWPIDDVTKNLQPDLPCVEETCQGLVFSDTLDRIVSLFCKRGPESSAVPEPGAGDSEGYLSILKDQKLGSGCETVPPQLVLALRKLTAGSSARARRSTGRFCHRRLEQRLGYVGRPETGAIVVTDTSRSLTLTALQYALDLSQRLHCAVRVRASFQADVSLHSSQNIFPLTQNSDLDELQAYQGGGTDFERVLYSILERKEARMASTIIYITDGYNSRLGDNVRAALRNKKLLFALLPGGMPADEFKRTVCDFAEVVAL